MFAYKYAAPVQKKDVAVGTLVWYKGFTSRGAWNCPGVIYRTSPKCQNYYVMSLDDMREQHQPYKVDLSDDPHSPNSRHNIRIASVAEVDAYLAGRDLKKTVAQIIAEVQAAAARVNAA